jgi:hypothetical protein
VAVAAGGGDDTPVSTETRFQGLLGPSNPAANLTVGPFRSGNCAARLTWTDGRTEVKMYVNDAASGTTVEETNRETTTSSRASWTCGQGVRYRVELYLQEPQLSVTYDLQLTVP